MPQPHSEIKSYAKDPNTSKVPTGLNDQSQTVDIIEVIHEELKNLDFDSRLDIQST